MNEFDFDITKYARGMSVRFLGGGGGAPKGPEAPKLTEMGKYSETAMWETTNRGLAGEGLLPGGLQDKIRSDYLGGLKKAYTSGRGLLSSYMNRTVDKEDAGVSKHLTKTYDAAYATTKDEYRRGTELQKYQDYETSQVMAADQLAGAKKMGVSLNSMYNQQIASNYAGAQTYGDFNSNVASGLGSAGGWMSAAQAYGKTNGGEVE